MAERQPDTELATQFSSTGATPTPWAEARALLETAEMFWLSTVRPDGRPHVTPLPAVWLEGALHFCTGEEERKAKNLARNPRCILTTGCNHYREGLDVVVEGEAVRVTDEALLHRLARRWLDRYDWHFAVRDGVFVDGASGNAAIVFAVAPVTAFGFRKGEPFSQTRWRFAHPGGA